MSHLIELHLKCRVDPARRADFMAFLREAVPFYESPGGISVRVLQEVHDEHRFIEVVEYRDEAVYQQDQVRVASDPIMKSYLERWRQLLMESPVVEEYRHISI